MFVVLQKCVSHCFCFATVDGHVSAKQGVFKLPVCSCCFKRKTRSFIWRCCFCTVKIRLGGLRRLILLKIKFKPHASARHVRVITSDLTVVRRNLLSSPTPPWSVVLTPLRDTGKLRLCKQSIFHLSTCVVLFNREKARPASPPSSSCPPMNGAWWWSSTQRARHPTCNRSMTPSRDSLQTARMTPLMRLRFLLFFWLALTYSLKASFQIKLKIFICPQT